MAYKREELDYIAAQLLPVVLEKLGVEAQGVSEVEVVSDLTGVFSLPAYKKVGGVEKVVEAPVSLLQDIALDSVNEATENAKAATGEPCRRQRKRRKRRRTIRPSVGRSSPPVTVRTPPPTA